MRNLFDIPWDSLPHDGASAPVGVSGRHDRADDEELMSAWLRERQENIEVGLYLERASDLLGRIVAGGEVTPAIMRRARHLLRSIEAALQGVRAG